MRSNTPLKGRTLKGRTLILAAPDGGLDPAVLPLKYTAAGPATITGTLSATDGSDTAAFIGEVIPGSITITGDLAATDGSDTASFAGLIAHVGTLAAIDGSDTAAFAGNIAHIGMLTATDGADTFSASGTVSSSVEDIYPGAGHPAGGSRISPHGLLKKRKKPFDTDLAEQMREAYNEILGIAKPQVKKQAAKIVRPFIESGVKPITIPPASIIDWQAMERDAARVSALLELWQSEMQALEDEEILLLLMAA